MKLRVGAGSFVPRLGPTLLTLLMLPILLGLGTWQVQRLHWKRELLVTMGERLHQAPADVPLADPLDVDYRPAKVSGIFRHDLTLYVLATNMLTGQGGYHVVTPLQLDNGAWLYVDRGWIPYELKQKENGFSQPSGAVEVQGILRVPSAPNWIQPHNNPAKGEWFSTDPTAMADAEKLNSVLPYVLDADDKPNQGGFPVGGQTRLNLPNDHFSYAVTWYSFALILLIIYGVSSYRKDDADLSALTSKE